MDEARRDQVLMQDGSIHSCGEGTKIYRPLANINGQRYYCTICGVVFAQQGDVYRATGAVVKCETATVEAEG